LFLENEYTLMMDPFLTLTGTEGGILKERVDAGVPIVSN
jgi:hypothetical protein